jgi:hypothetical protein
MGVNDAKGLHMSVEDTHKLVELVKFLKKRSDLGLCMMGWMEEEEFEDKVSELSELLKDNGVPIGEE